jgi:predicted nicotinamide N-methyase
MKSAQRKKRQRKETSEESAEASPKRRPTAATKDAKESSCQIFQDAMKKIDANSTKTANDEVILEAFFELANSPLVGFRINRREQDAPCVVIRQDIGTTAHTGGIVWETAYLLLQYLLSKKMKLGRTLEVGAGCGLLGQVLAATKAATEVVMTEHDLLIQALTNNVERNQDLLKSRGCGPVHVHNLDWENYELDAANAEHLEAHSFDTIIGTDVVFTPKLVEPLWKTLQYMSHSKTNIYLCLQERCEASHKLLLQKAPSFTFQLKDITKELDSVPSCKWGQVMECRLFHVTL